MPSPDLPHRIGRPPLDVAHASDVARTTLPAPLHAKLVLRAAEERVSVSALVRANRRLVYNPWHMNRLYYGDNLDVDAARAYEAASRVWAVRCLRLCRRFGRLEESTGSGPE